MLLLPILGSIRFIRNIRTFTLAGTTACSWTRYAREWLQITLTLTVSLDTVRIPCVYQFERQQHRCPGHDFGYEAIEFLKSELTLGIRYESTIFFSYCEAVRSRDDNSISFTCTPRKSFANHRGMKLNKRCLSSGVLSVILIGVKKMSQTYFPIILKR